MCKAFSRWASDGQSISKAFTGMIFTLISYFLRYHNDVENIQAHTSHHKQIKSLQYVVLVIDQRLMSYVSSLQCDATLLMERFRPSQVGVEYEGAFKLFKATYAGRRRSRVDYQ
jgi:hypothetical protein